MISHACISAEGSESTVASTRAIHSARPLPRARTQGQRGRARAPHVARQPQVHSIPQDHQQVPPLSANKITTTFSPLKMGAIYALPPDVLKPARFGSPKAKRKARISGSVRPPGDSMPCSTSPRNSSPRTRKIAPRAKVSAAKRIPPARSRRNSTHRSAPAFQVSIARDRRRS